MLKGQSAVEFLMTYGWAILALLVVLGVLVYSGVLTPTYLISDECKFGPNTPCSFALFNEGGSTRIILEVFNGNAYKIRITKLSLSTEDGLQQFSGFDKDVDIESGDKAPFEGTLSGPPIPEGTIKRFRGNITFVSCAPEVGGCGDNEHVQSGKVVGRLIPE